MSSIERVRAIMMPLFVGVLTPSSKGLVATHCVDGVYRFAAFISFPPYPVAVKVGEQAIDVVCSNRVSVPFCCIVS